MLTYHKEPPRPLLNEFAYKLRDGDRREIFAATGESSEVVVHESWAASREPYLFCWNDKPVAALGCSPLTQTIGAPWMLATDLFEEIPAKLIIRLSMHFVCQWHREFHLLTNYVDERNAVARRYLKRLGFVERETIPYGHSKLPFIRFERHRCVNQPLS